MYNLCKKHTFEKNIRRKKGNRKHTRNVLVGDTFISLERSLP